MKSVLYEIKPAGWLTCQLLKRLWRGCLVTKLNGFQLRDVTPPALPSQDWVRVRTLLGGVCGSDVAMVQQKQSPDSLLQAYTSQPIAMGHENVAVVEEVGAGVDEAWLGRRVLVEPTLGCVPRGITPLCPRCAVGEFGACENFSGNPMGGATAATDLPPGVSTGYNAATGGSWGETFVAHQSQLIPVDDSISDEAAVLVDSFACSLHAVLRADLSQVRTVLLYGAGMLGLAGAGCLRALDFDGRIDLLGRRRSLEPLAKQLGADEYITLPNSKPARFAEMASRTGSTVQRARFGNYMLSGGYDLVIDCVGSRQSIEECLKWTRARGQVIMLGTLQRATMDLTPLWFRELKLLGAYGRQLETFPLGSEQRTNTYQIVLDWIKEGRLPLEGLLTHTFRIEEYQQALRVAMSKGRYSAVKVAFDFR